MLAIEAGLKVMVILGFRVWVQIGFGGKVGIEFGGSMKSASKVSAASTKLLAEGEEIQNPSSNYMISMAKYHVLVLLNHLLDSHKATDYIYYLYRRELDPDGFRMNLAYQDYFFK
jgi:hypothetical protein